MPEGQDAAREDLRVRAASIFQLPKIPGPIGPGSFESNSNAAAAGADEKDVQDAEAIEHPQLDTLNRGLIELKAARRHLTKAAFQESTTESDPERYGELLQDIEAARSAGLRHLFSRP
ncbi:hypothetical protein ACIOC1_34345 [Streptomyces sp. NPDC088197]|uniref:hypothetical protein n=1 Tax=Streptomyces sp. NPDC088197 TaxID=3365840 RepID=UPI00381B2F67